MSEHEWTDAKRVVLGHMAYLMDGMVANADSGNALLPVNRLDARSLMAALAELDRRAARIAALEAELASRPIHYGTCDVCLSFHSVHEMERVGDCLECQTCYAKRKPAGPPIVVEPETEGGE